MAESCQKCRTLWCHLEVGPADFHVMTIPTLMETDYMVPRFVKIQRPVDSVGKCAIID